MTVQIGQGLRIVKATVVVVRVVLAGIGLVFLLLSVLVPFWLLPAAGALATTVALRRVPRWAEQGRRWPLVLAGLLLLAGGISLVAFAVAELHILDPQRSRGGGLSWTVCIGGGAVLLLAGLVLAVAGPRAHPPTAGPLPPSPQRRN